LLLKALNLAACSQGTMNNLVFGNQSFGFYETICGGTGAGNGFDGCSAVHQHMTNTRITDPEIMEHRYPVEVGEFSIRRNSGGSGQYKGGDGIKRTIRFKEAVTLNLLSQHRSVAPYGLQGGGDGQTGQQFIEKANGDQQELPGVFSARLEAGDKFTILTPGGGGFGGS
jgi:5-oxoprolinase (ATP-hydrolysing)